MKQLFPKALLYKEWKNARWGFALMTLLLMFDRVFSAASRLNNLKEMAARGDLVIAYNTHWFQSFLYDGGIFGYTLITIAALVFLLFHHDRQEATASLIASMPLTKSQAYKVKWLTGVGAITGASLVNGLLLSGFYFANRTWMFSTSYQVIPTWIGLHLLFSLAAFSFLLFVQSCMGHSLAATVVGPITSLVPWFVLAGLGDIIRHQFRLPYDSPLIIWLGQGESALFWPSSLIGTNYVSDSIGIYYPVYYNLPSRFLVLIIITAVCTWLGHTAYKRNSVEKLGQLLMFPSLEPVLIYGFALCLALLLTLMFGFGYGETNVSVTNTFLLAGFIGGWFIAKRVVMYYRH